MLKCDSNFQGIHQSWAQSHYDICGNATLEQAQVVFVTYPPNNWDIAQKNIRLINQIGQGHLLLVEEISKGKKIAHWEHNFTIGLGSGFQEIKGWDHPQFKRCCNKLRQRRQMINDSIKVLQVALKALIRVTKTRDWGCFLDVKNAFTSLLNHCSEETRDQEMRKLNNFLKGHHDLQLLILDLIQSVRSIKADHNQYICRKYAELWQPRLSSLISSIDEELQKHKKIFVLLDGSWIIRDPNLQAPEFDPRNIEIYLEKKKFIVLNFKQSPLSIVNNPKLWTNA